MVSPAFKKKEKGGTFGTPNTHYLLPEFGIKLLGIKLLSLAGARIVEYGSKLLSLGYFIHFT